MPESIPVRRADVDAVLSALAAGEHVDSTILRQLVKATVELLVARAPGLSVELRIPPYAAAQVVPGVVHRRGTPPALVECDPATWLALAAGLLSWQQALASPGLRASGERSDLSGFLPLIGE